MCIRDSRNIDEEYTPAPAKPFRSPRGFNKQGTGVGNKLAQQNRKEWEEKKRKEKGVAESTNYWTRLQNERNTKIASLVNELKESINK